MLKRLAIAAVAVVVILVAVISMQPATYKVERSLDMSAPAAAVFPLVNDYKARVAWYPWDKLDPNQKRTYSEPSSGVGASYGWDGNDQVGKGSQKMTLSKVNERIEEELHFITPMESTARVSFAFAPAGEGTKITWTLEGDNDFMGKAFGLVMSMDKMIGPDFESGLAALKTASEKLAAEQAAAAKAAAEAAAAAATAAAEAEKLKATEAAAAAE